MASRTSSVRVNDDPDGQVNLRYLPEADMYVGMSLHLGQCTRTSTPQDYPAGARHCV